MSSLHTAKKHFHTISPFLYKYISCVNVALAVLCCCCYGGLGPDHPTRAPATERMLHPSFDWISQVGSANRQNPLWDEKKSGDPVLAALAPAVAERRPACWRLNVEMLLNATAETKGLGLGSVVSSNGLAFTSPSKGYDCPRDLPGACALHALCTPSFQRAPRDPSPRRGKFLCDCGVTLAWFPSRHDANLLREIKVYLPHFNQEVGDKKTLLVFLGGGGRIDIPQRWFIFHFHSGHTSKNPSRESRIHQIYPHSFHLIQANCWLHIHQ